MFTQKFKLKIANWLYNKFPKRFCWAELVAWSYSSKIFPAWDKNKSGDGCKKASENEQTCYCGTWCQGKHYSDKDFNYDYFKSEPIEENIIPF